jgi:hypothetical protein
MAKIGNGVTIFYFLRMCADVSRKRIIYILVIVVLFAAFCEARGELKGADLSHKIDLRKNVSLEYEKIKGDIKLIDETIYKPIIIENCEIDGNLIFKNSNFLSKVSFRNVTVSGQSSFLASNFSKRACFEKSRFKGKANFESVSFAEAVFDESEFLEDATFKDCSINKNSGFRAATFNKDAIFTTAKFRDDSQFNYVRFKGDASFRDSLFAKKAEFNSAIFSGEADFYKARFQGDAIFSKLKSSKDCDFSYAEFLNGADFSDSRFGGIVDFRGFRSLGNLTLKGARFDQLYLPWKEAKDRLQGDEQLYLSLINSYKQRGLFDDVDDCYYSFRERYPPSYPFSGLIEQMLKYLYGWGVRPFNTVKISFVFIGLFGLYFWLVHVPAKTSETDRRSGIPGSSLFTALILSAKIFASALTSVVSETSLDGQAGNAAKLEKFLAHVLAALFLLALAKTILRDII